MGSDAFDDEGMDGISGDDIAFEASDQKFDDIELFVGEVHEAIADFGEGGDIDGFTWFPTGIEPIDGHLEGLGDLDAFGEVGIAGTVDPLRDILFGDIEDASQLGLEQVMMFRGFPGRGEALAEAGIGR